MRKYYFVKHGTPVWIRVPGTPLTLTGFPSRYDRLPGMTEWAPRDVIERVGQGLKDDTSVDELAARERNRGLLSDTAKGGVVGGGLGAFAGRLQAGKAATKPFREILNKGLSSETARGLKNVPRMAKILPLIGLGAGLAGGVGTWAAGRGERGHEAREVSKGLLTEDILQHHALGKARSSLNPALKNIPASSASVEAPSVAVLGNTGV